MVSATPDCPSTQPLLGTSDSDFCFPTKSSHVSLRALENGDASIFEIDDEELRSRFGFWTRLRMSLRRRDAKPRVHDALRGVRLSEDDKVSKNWRLRRIGAARACVIIPLLLLIFFGILHMLNVFLGYVPTFLDDGSPLPWTRPGKASPDIGSHLLDITRDVVPVPCHSHNDYWRKVPLYDALRWGCTGVEADVWLFDEELYVGHHTNSLTQDRTFRSMYVDPLLKMLDHKNQIGTIATKSIIKNGVFETDPAQTLVLLVDFKNNGHKTFPVVSQHLNALREKGYLTYFDGQSTVEGAITVVATGNAPFDLITANSTYRDIFFDAPLDKLYQDPTSDKPGSGTVVVSKRGGQGTVGTTPESRFDSTNSYYASVNFGRSIGWLWFGHISEAKMDKIRGQICGARAQGLKSRYWSAPKWPIGLRNRVWKMLMEEGVGYLNGDDLAGMTRIDWSIKKHWGLLT